MTEIIENHNGWTVRKSTFGRTHFSASQYGVGLNSSTLEGIRKNIDLHIWQQREAVKSR